MEGRLAGKVVAVTGAESGIGRAIALRCAHEGASVVIAGVNVPGAEKAAAEVNDAGGKAIAVSADVRDPGQVQAMIAQTVERFGRIDAAVANAGIFTGTPFLDLDIEEWNNVVATDLTGVFLTLQAAARAMVRQGQGGSLLATGSSTAIRPGTNRLPYAVSKAGVHLMARALALELAPHNIRINVIAPGLTETPATVSRPGYIERGLAIVPMHETVQPEELAGLAAFILSDEARHMNGSVVSLDAGRTAD
jgi:NAD(P)-dependent dehydrogenase (short-subunit alcohol dehydrogenase family)